MRNIRYALVLLASLAACGGGSGDGGNGPNPVLVVTPDTLDISDCTATQLVVTLEDSDGRPIPGATFSFTSTAPGIASVSDGGNVAAMGAGSATIVVRSGGLIVNVPVTVSPGPYGILGAGDSLLLWPGIVDTVAANLATCHGVLASPVTPASFTTTGNAGVATVANGMVTGQSYGRTTIGWTAGTHSGQLPVRVIGHPLGTSITPSPLDLTPYGVAVTASGKVVVTQLGSQYLATGQLPGTALASQAIAVDFQPPHVTVNPAGTLAFVTSQAGQAVSVVDLVQEMKTSSVPLGADGFNLLMTKDGAEVFVTTATGLTYILNAVGVKVDSFAIGPVSNGLAEHPTQPLVYLSSRDGGSVTVYNRQLDAPVDTFLTGGRPQRMAVSPDGARLYIANEDLGLDIWSTATGTRVTAIAMPAYGLGLSPDGTQIIVTSAGGSIRFVDVQTLAVTPVTLPGAGTTRNVAFEANGRTAIVTDQDGIVYFIR